MNALQKSSLMIFSLISPIKRYQRSKFEELKKKLGNLFVYVIYVRVNDQKIEIKTFIIVNWKKKLYISKIKKLNEYFLR